VRLAQVRLNELRLAPLDAVSVGIGERAESQVAHDKKLGPGPRVVKRIADWPVVSAPVAPVEARLLGLAGHLR